MERISQNLEKRIRFELANKTKPVGSLGILEDIATQVGLIQNTINPKIISPHVVVFAGDHGISEENVSAYPKEVTSQMVINMLSGGAAINILTTSNNLNLLIVDSGVDHQFDENSNLMNCKVGYGTNNFLRQPAMTIKELDKCFHHGKNVIGELKNKGANTIGFGEMGISNSSSAALLMKRLSGLPLDKCICSGTGLSKLNLKHKYKILSEADEKYVSSSDPLDSLRVFGGFEIAQMVAAMIEAAKSEMVIVVDGFISAVAFLVAWRINNKILENVIFGHTSNNGNMRTLLDYLNVDPLLHLGMRLGEGTGSAIAIHLIQNSIDILNKMATFTSSGVSTKTNS